ncbi:MULTISPECIES: FMN-binding glutamate synthase family protein [Exiguobacterium]|uniref:FMN-binding glutamate synthase family protein n=1 Tax=Exiguobacterium antarcticum TaxID=132920 RepID=A0ABT6R3W0_9BACL|nr:MULTISPECIES: FMN-binding glutamate synthase family protein [Exiguobacterium]MDI3235639.1 FMN-binding glutamate synthase family protein [Exiguobacterium antarcticum]
MSTDTIILTIILTLISLILFVPLSLGLYLWNIDHRQQEHSILRNFPVLGKIRYILEKIGPELRQYLFLNNNEDKPFSRNDYKTAVLSGKYNTRTMGFGSERDFEQAGFYLQNALFPTNRQELRVDNQYTVSTHLYQLDQDNLLTRKEHLVEKQIAPFLLPARDAPIIGEHTCRQPFQVFGLIGQSAMSFGALGDRAITALSIGLGRARGTWMNTGEGGLSDYHLKGDVDIIFQIGPGLFGVRTEDGTFSLEEFKKKSELTQIKAFELKLAQGAKTRGGHLEGEKVSAEIAAVRNVKVGVSIDSPNRFNEFKTAEEMLAFVELLRETGGKPVGIKLVVGNLHDLHELVAYMAESGKHPDFITVDGGEGGTGASFQELADAAGLPLKSALPYLHQLLVAHGIRDRIKLFASGKLISADKIAVALGLGADFVNIARGLMFNVGCIQAQVCHTNHCPVGVATTDPKLQQALIVDEKSFRVTNYIISLREGLYNLTAAAGLTSPTELSAAHIIYKQSNGQVTPATALIHYPTPPLS